MGDFQEEDARPHLERLAEVLEARDLPVTVTINAGPLLQVARTDSPFMWNMSIKCRRAAEGGTWCFCRPDGGDLGQDVAKLADTIQRRLIDDPNQPLTLAEYDRLDDPLSGDFGRLDSASQEEYHAREHRRHYERRVNGHPWWEQGPGLEPVDPFGDYDHWERAGWMGSPDRHGPHLLALPAGPHRNDYLDERYSAASGMTYVRRVIPEAVEYKIEVFQQLSTAGETFTQLLIALSLSPFITAIWASLGSKAADRLTKEYRKAVKRLLKDRSKAARAVLPVVGTTTVEFEMRVEGTRVRIELPSKADHDLLATCIFMLGQMEFEIFGDCRTLLYWSEDTWHAAAAVPAREPVSLIWKAEDREWQPLHSGVELPLPRRK